MRLEHSRQLNREEIRACFDALRAVRCHVELDRAGTLLFAGEAMLELSWLSDARSPRKLVMVSVLTDDLPHVAICDLAENGDLTFQGVVLRIYRAGG